MLFTRKTWFETAVVLLGVILLVGLGVVLFADDVDVDRQATLLLDGGSVDGEVKGNGDYEFNDYEFTYPVEWNVDDSEGFVQFRNGGDRIAMNLFCPGAELDYELWETAELTERRFERNEIPYKVKYMYLTPKDYEGDVGSDYQAIGGETSSVVAILMSSEEGEDECQIVAQDVEERLDDLKRIYFSIR